MDKELSNKISRHMKDHFTSYTLDHQTMVHVIKSSNSWLYITLKINELRPRPTRAPRISKIPTRYRYSLTLESAEGKSMEYPKVINLPQGDAKYFISLANFLDREKSHRESVGTLETDALKFLNTEGPWN